MEFIDLQAQRRRLGPDIDLAIAQVLDHGAFINGPEVAELETELAEFSGAKNCVTCGNGTDALVLAMKAIGLVPGQAVIVPSFTFAATVEAVALAGGVPVFADIEADTFNIDPAAAAAARVDAADAGLDVVGLVGVDLFGQPADYHALTSRLPGLWILADAAQSFGASTGTVRVGAIASVTTTSFFPAKPLGCYGDGGAIFVGDDAMAEELRSLRGHGQGSDKYDNVRVGTNSRLDTLQAAILKVKLSAFPRELEERQRVADMYGVALAGAGITTPTVRNGCKSAWAQYTIRVPNRDRVAAALKQRGIPTAIYYRQPLHMATAYSRYRRCELPETERAAGDVLSLPMYPDMTPDLTSAVVDAVLDCV